MPVTINGTTGIAGVDGSAGTPAMQGTDTNTGIFFPAADTIAFAEGGAEVMRIDSSGNVQIGTTTNKTNSWTGGGTGLTIGAATAPTVAVWDTTDSSYVGSLTQVNADLYLTNTANGIMVFNTNNTERARIDSSGNLLVGKTSASSTVVGVNLSGTGGENYFVYGSVSGGQTIALNRTASTGAHILFQQANNTVGSVTVTASSTAYNTSSDYRLKHDVQPMTGALAKVAALKPVTYKWNLDDSPSEGFIAHELAEVVPQCVTGEKDAVDAEGKPVYQGIDTSFLVATLTAAIQELKAELDTAKARIAALEAA